MDQKKLRFIEIIALTAAAVVTVLVLLRASDGNFDVTTILFLGWAVSPYFCFFVAARLLEKFTSLKSVSMISFIISILMLGFTLLMYFGLFNSGSSTDALIFVLAPLYLFVGSFAFLILGLVLAKLANRRGDVNS